MNVVGSIVIKATAVLAALLIMAVSVFLAGQVVNADPEDYDTNGNGILEKDEVLAVVIDYFRDRISKDDVLEVLVLYFLKSASPEPPPTPTPTPTPTPVPTTTRPQEDVTPPELIGLTIETPEVDISVRDGTIRVRVRVTDDLSGISNIDLGFRSPRRNRVIWVGAGGRRESGTSTDGVYKGANTVPQFSESGTWRLTEVRLSDRVGNNRQYQRAELSALGLATSFEVVGTQSPVPTGIRPRSEWTEENPATLQELEWEIERYRGSSFEFTSWGGVYQAAQRQAYIIPFQEKFGIDVVESSPMSYSRISAMVQTGNYIWHVMDVGGLELWNQIALGNLEELDMSVVDNRNHVETVRTIYGGGGGITWSTVLAYNTNSYPEGSITDWNAFFDRNDFPGERSVGGSNTYSGSWSPWFSALLAIDHSRLSDADWKKRLGAPTDEDVQAALAYWEANPPDHFWATGSDCPALLKSGEIDMCTAWNTRIYDYQVEGAPIAICWKCGHLVGTDVFVMAKGLKEANPQGFEIGQLFIAWTGHPEINSQMAKYSPYYGPVNLKAAENLNAPEFDKVRSAIPTSQVNLPFAIFENGKVSTKKYDEWVNLWSMVPIHR